MFVQDSVHECIHHKIPTLFMWKYAEIKHRDFNCLHWAHYESGITVFHTELESPVGHRKETSSLTLYREEFAFNESVMQTNERPVIWVYNTSDWHQFI
jgi:hypothetical protein